MNLRTLRHPTQGKKVIGGAAGFMSELKLRPPKSVSPPEGGRYECKGWARSVTADAPTKTKAGRGGGWW